MNQLVKEGISIIMISSEMPELLSMCDNLMLMNNGKALGVVPAKRYDEDSIMKFITGAETLEI